MRFAPTDDETLVEDTLDRLLAEAEARAPRGPDGAAPMPDAAARRAKLAELGLWAGWLPESLAPANRRPFAWRGADRAALEAVCETLGDTRSLERVPRWRTR